MSQVISDAMQSGKAACHITCIQQPQDGHIQNSPMAHPSNIKHPQETMVE
jgi:hypothetical protein